LSKIENIFNL